MKSIDERRTDYFHALETWQSAASFLPFLLAALLVFSGGGWLLFQSAYVLWRIPFIWPVLFVLVLALLIGAGVALSEAVRCIGEMLYRALYPEDQLVRKEAARHATPSITPAELARQRARKEQQEREFIRELKLIGLWIVALAIGLVVVTVQG